MDLRIYSLVQRLEILEHKWYLSETAKKEISMSDTIQSWIDTGHAHRFRTQYEKNQRIIEDTLRPIVYSSVDYRTLENKVSMKQIHELLND